MGVSEDCRERVAMGSPWNWQKGKGQNFSYQQYPKGGFPKGGGGGAHTSMFSPAGAWRKGGGGQSWGGGWQNTNDKIEMLGSVVENIGNCMEYEQWMKSEKEWKEAELKKEEDARKEREKEAEVRKREREEMFGRVKEEQQNFLSEVKKEVVAPARAALAQRGGSKRKEAVEDEEEYGDYRESLRKAPRKQNARSPVDVEEWTDWECSAKNAAFIRKAFPGCCTVAQLRGEGILECAEAVVASDKCPQKAALTKKYKDNASVDAPARWGRVDLVVGVIAEVVER